MGDSFTFLVSFISGATTLNSSPSLSRIAFLYGDDEARMSDTDVLIIVKYSNILLQSGRINALINCSGNGQQSPDW